MQLIHGHRAIRTPTYNSWRKMRERCRNPNQRGYKDYGGRGVSICDRWNQFVNFLEDMGERPIGMTLDRINADGNYEPGNCKWSTHKEQRANQRRNHG